MIVDGFHELYYESRRETWQNTHWLGVSTLKCPLDLWVYQEILWETRPRLLIECGTAAGGSALFFASLFDLLGDGEVVTVDIGADATRPAHPRITYLTGSSTDPAIVAAVSERARAASPVMVVLDSDHAADHVRAELDAYAPLVTPGHYLVVEDTNLNGHPVFPDYGPGPAEAVTGFLADSPGFVVDRSREKLLLTFNPGGYLRRA